MTIREQTKQAIENYDYNKINRLIAYTHTSHNSHWIEVHTNGVVSEAEEADNYTRHYIEYPNKPVEELYTFHTFASVCDCDICTMFRVYDEYSTEEFIEKWGEDNYSWMQDTSLEDAIVEFESNNGYHASDVIEAMLEALNAIPYGYFNDERDKDEYEDEE